MGGMKQTQEEKKTNKRLTGFIWIIKCLLQKWMSKIEKNGQQKQDVLVCVYLKKCNACKKDVNCKKEFHFFPVLKSFLRSVDLTKTGQFFFFFSVCFFLFCIYNISLWSMYFIHIYVCRTKRWYCQFQKIYTHIQSVGLGIPHITLPGIVKFLEIKKKKTAKK